MTSGVVQLEGVLGTLAGDAIEELTWRVKAEYFEMPGMRLTLAQARCLFDIESDVCRVILDDLCASGFLTRTRNGLYARLTQQ